MVGCRVLKPQPTAGRHLRVVRIGRRRCQWSVKRHDIRKWWNDAINITCHVTGRVVKWEQPRESLSVGAGFLLLKSHDNKLVHGQPVTTIVLDGQPRLTRDSDGFFVFFGSTVQVCALWSRVIRAPDEIWREKKVKRCDGPARYQMADSPGFFRSILIYTLSPVSPTPSPPLDLVCERLQSPQTSTFLSFITLTPSTLSPLTPRFIRYNKEISSLVTWTESVKDRYTSQKVTLENYHEGGPSGTTRGNVYVTRRLPCICRRYQLGSTDQVSRRWSSEHCVMFGGLSSLLFDWSVCLLTLKHLVSLQAHTRPSFHVELDLHTVVLPS